MMVLDPQEAREEVDREFINALDKNVAQVPGCIVWTKSDLLDSEVVGRVSVTLGETRMAHWETFATRYDQADTMLEPINFILSRIANS
jgi:hypothetical protein